MTATFSNSYAFQTSVYIAFLVANITFWCLIF